MNRKNFQDENSCHDTDVAKVRKMQKKLPHGCGGEQMNRKNFQNENSCHDMDIAKSSKKNGGLLIRPPKKP